MPIEHKFLNRNWQNGFETHDTILHSREYSPEMIFIGSFNHGWIWNPADFFYGRGMYMWTILSNLFLHNMNLLMDRRTTNNNDPTLDEIFEICKIGKISFADIIHGTQEHIPIAQHGETIIVNNQYLWAGYKDSALNFMGNQGWLEDNVEEIIYFINNTPSLKHIYFTFKSGNWLVQKADFIIHQTNRSSGSIFTPTGNGFGINLPEPFHLRPWTLTHCWVWNGLQHEININKIGYIHLNHDWLLDKGVDINNF